ncbi:MAG: BolA family transcriptional regulator [Ancalomicrobiaceae bacterium]|nr:BolA family transcriptional regulator [Ancalomicrobiaceae bacterium]
MSTRDRILAKLTEAFRPEAIEVVDESDQHHGHAGVHGSRGETHFRIRIVAASLTGKSRIEQHRVINSVLKDELAAGVHALAIEAKSA